MHLFEYKNVSLNYTDMYYRKAQEIDRIDRPISVDAPFEKDDLVIIWWVPWWKPSRHATFLAFTRQNKNDIVCYFVTHVGLAQSMNMNRTPGTRNETISWQALKDWPSSRKNFPKKSFSSVHTRGYAATSIRVARNDHNRRRRVPSIKIEFLPFTRKRREDTPKIYL